MEGAAQAGSLKAVLLCALLFALGWCLAPIAFSRDLTDANDLYL